MTKRKFASAILLLLVVSILFNSFAYAASGIRNAFNEDFYTTLDSYSDYYGWDLTTNSSDEWVSDITGDTIKWSSTYQSNLLSDNMTTTAKHIWGEDVDLLGATLGISGMTLLSSSGGTIAEVALEQYALGVKESPLGSNNVPYNTWYYGHAVSGSKYPWCCVFVSWCMEQCGYVTDGVWWLTASCTYALNTLRNDFGCSWTYVKNVYDGTGGEPQAGDLLFYMKSSTVSGHIGIVVDYDATTGTLKTVEGNASDKVNLVTHDASSTESTFKNGIIVRPNYPD